MSEETAESPKGESLRCGTPGWWRRHDGILIDVAVLLFLTLIGLQYFNNAIEKYYAFNHNTVEDKAIFNHLLWNLSHHLSWQNTVHFYADNYLSNHFSLIYLPLSFIYALWPKPEMCWLMLNIALAGAVFLLYRLAAERLRTRVGAFLAVVLLVAHPMFSRNLLIEGWRDTAWAVCFLCLALWAWERKRFALFIAGFALAALCKEDIPFIGIGFTALAFIQRRAWRWKIFPACFGVLYACLAFWAMRHLGDIWEGQDLSRYAYLGKPGPEALWNMIVHPGLWTRQVFSPAKLSAMRDLFGPLGYLSFLAPEFLIAPASQFAEVLLADQSYIPQPGYWYVTPTAPFVFYSAVVGVGRLMKLAEWATEKLLKAKGRLTTAEASARLSTGTAWIAALALGVAACGPLLEQARLLAQFRSWLIFHPVDARRDRVNDLLAAIPPNARVCVQNPYTLMYSSRRYIHCLPIKFDEAEYIVVNASENRWPASEGEYRRILERLADPRAYSRVHQLGETNVYLRLPPRPSPPLQKANGLVGEFYPFYEPLISMPDYSKSHVTFRRPFRVVDFPFNEREFVSADGDHTGFLNWFVATFSGHILIERPGEYVFTVESDDGFRLWIDGRNVGEYLGVRAFSQTDMSVTLAKGAHAVKLEYFDNEKPCGLSFYWTPPGGERAIVPASVLRCYMPSESADSRQLPEGR